MKVELVNGTIKLSPQPGEEKEISKFAEKYKNIRSIPFSAFIKLLTKCPYQKEQP
jgi:hypothetical protein